MSNRKPDAFRVEELELTIKALNEKMSLQEEELKRMKFILKDNDLLDELEAQSTISPEEEVCVKGIEQILEMVRLKSHTPADIKNFDILHNHLLRIRGKNPVDNKKQKVTNVADLLRIVKEG